MQADERGDERLVSLEELRAARGALPPEVLHTPLLPSEELGRIAGAQVWLKTESLQVTGSYKARAAYTVLSRLSPEQSERGAAISSSGNFASAWAYMGRLLGIPTAVVMQQRTSPLKLEKTRGYGAEIVICPDDFEARWQTLAVLEAERGILSVNTFESRDVILGHGTIGLEMVSDLEDVDTVLVPVSSGGLIAGVAAAVKYLRPAARVVGIQPQGAAAATLSLQKGAVISISSVDTICDALIATRPGALPFLHLQRFVDEMVLVTDDEVKAAIRWLVEQPKLVAEAGGAVGVAALLTGKVRPQGKTIVLVSGGNIMPSTLAAYLLEGS